jgi:hypothetical protein
MVRDGKAGHLDIFFHHGFYSLIEAIIRPLNITSLYLYYGISNV